MVIDAKNKSLFVLPALAVVAMILLFSLFQVYFDWSQRTAWIGVAIAALPLPILMIRLMTSRTVRTSENLPSLMLLAGGGFVIAVWQQLVEFRSGWVPTAMAGVAALIFVSYVYWYSRFGRIASGELAVGSKFPAFALNDSSGKQFESLSIQGSPAVILFYRGNWCPLCMAQIGEIVDRYKDLDALGVKVVMISSQSEIASRDLAEKFAVPITFLVDAQNELAESLGIGVRNGVPFGVTGSFPPDTAMPTLIVVNANGTIIFSDQTDNYRVRPEPDMFLAILRRSGVKPR